MIFPTLVDKQVQKIKMIKISLNLRLNSIVSIDLYLDDPIDAIKKGSCSQWLATS